MEPAADMAMLEWQDGYFAGGIGQWSPDRSLDPFSVVSPGAEDQFTSCSSTFGGGRSFSNDLPTSMSSGLFPHPAVLESPFLTAGGGGVGFLEAEEGPDVDMGKFSCPAAVAEHHFAEGSRRSSSKRKADGRGHRQEARDCMGPMIQDGDHGDSLVVPKLESPAITSCTRLGRIAGAGADRKGKPTAGKERSSETSELMHPKASGGPAAKADYIHVRARRGQATDSHSLAERARREKISKRMKLLQDLVPGCSKVTGKASVLEEIINYVQSLQRQVEFLSMRLAASASPIFDDHMEAFLNKEVMQMIQLPQVGGVAPPSMAGMLLPPALLDSSFLVHANDIVQTLQATAMRAAVGCSSLEDAVHVGSSCPDEHAAALLQGSAGGTPDLATKCCSQLESYKVRAMAPTCPWKGDLHGFYDADELRREQLGVGVIPSSAGAGDVSGFPDDRRPPQPGQAVARGVVPCRLVL